MSHADRGLVPKVPVQAHRRGLPRLGGSERIASIGLPVRVLGVRVDWQQIQPFLIALAIGLLLGFERERSHHRELPAGSRSFALLALAGAVAASFDTWAVVVGLVVFGALLGFAYFRTSEEDPGTTTEIAALVAYLLGALAYSRPALSVALAVIVVGLLISKTRIHRFASKIVSEVEMEDAIKFFVVAFVVLPLLPDQPIGPYGVLNPAKIWLLVVLLTGIGWVGYIGVRALGPQRGLLVTGLAGGFVSATATTASMGRLSRTAAGTRGPLAGALLASLATFIQLLIVIGLVDIEVLRRLWLPVLVGLIVLLCVAVLVYRGASRGHQEVAADGDEARPKPASRPFALRPALVLAAVLTLALLVGRWVPTCSVPGVRCSPHSPRVSPTPTPVPSQRPVLPRRAISPSTPRSSRSLPRSGPT